MLFVKFSKTNIFGIRSIFTICCNSAPGIYTNETFLRLIQTFVNSYQPQFVLTYELEEKNFYGADVKIENNSDHEICLKMHRSIAFMLGRVNRYEKEWPLCWLTLEFKTVGSSSKIVARILLCFPGY